MTTHRVTDWTLRSIFNRSGIWEAAQAGTHVIIREEHEPDPAFKQPAGTVSVTTVIYAKDSRGLLGDKLARCHHYENPDGSIRHPGGGNADRPDPKMVRMGSDIYVLAPRSVAAPLVPKKPPPRPRQP